MTPKDIDVSALPHGSYEMRVLMTGYVGNTLISSNILYHNVVRYNSDVGQPIFSYLLPSAFEQYSEINLNYMLVYGDSQKSYILKLFVDNEEIASENIVSNILNTYPLSFDKAGTYKLSMQIADLNINETIDIEV
jgi:hypothetical protein